MDKHLVAAGAAIAVLVTSTSAWAAKCANRDLVIERLQSKYSESLAAGGLQKFSDTEHVVEVWASAETGTFTVMLTSPNGLSCVMATGTDWHQVPLKTISDQPPTGSPS
ncbi:MAG: hypothetical protein AAGF53_05650 [Pseudomonadota bacterium]